MPRRLNTFSLLLAAITSVAAVNMLRADSPKDPGSSAGAALGKPAPDFSLSDTFIKHAHGKGPLKDLAKRVSNDKLVWLAINSNAKDKRLHRQVQRQIELRIQRRQG